MKYFNKKRKIKKENDKQIGIILLDTVTKGILTEKALKKHGFSTKKVPPPREYRRGCEISIQFDYDKLHEVEDILKKYDIQYEGIIKL